MLAYLGKLFIGVLFVKGQARVSVESFLKAGAAHQRIKQEIKGFSVYTFKPEHTVFHWGT